MNTNILDIALEKGLSGVGLSPDEARVFISAGAASLYEMLSVTERVRQRHKGVEISLCSIVNAKSGLCKEDCSFCSQSVNYSTGIDDYPMQGAKDIVRAADQAKSAGAREFSIVTSGTGINKEADISTLEQALISMKSGVSVERCASLGIMRRETLKRLKHAGLESFHHNLETSRSFFPNVCTTHGYDDDVNTIRTAKELGLKVCSGGIFGIGESWDDRIELASTLKELDVDSIPINFLNPRPGTPLQGASNLTPVKCLKIIALFRAMLPRKDIVVCGGRQLNLRSLEPLIFAAGANGMLTGNYLTTPGKDPADDLKMLSDLGLKPKGH